MTSKSITRLSLCANVTCPIRKLCMRFKLIGDRYNDVWVEFKPIKFKGQYKCKSFVHINSYDAKQYIESVYGDKKFRNYED
jgi:hypothetical protein